MRRRLKIVRIFSRLNIGGPAIHVVNLTAGLRSHGYDSTLVVGSISKDEGDMNFYSKQQGVSPLIIPDLQAPIHPIKDFLAFVQILKIIWREKPDIVHTHTFKAGVLGRLAALICRVPLRVHTYHGHLLEGYGGKLKTNIIVLAERLMNLATHKIISVSHLVARDLIQHRLVPPQKMNVVELGFDMKYFFGESMKPATLRRKLGLSESDIVVGIVGRLVPIKQVELLLMAISPLFSEFGNLHLVVIGDGGERAKLEKLTQELPGHFHFIGWCVPMPPEYKDLDLAVCSSKNEGTSVSLIEAILTGIPVISTRVGGMADLLGNGQFGDLVASNEDALRDKLRQRISLITNPIGPDYDYYHWRTVRAQKVFFKRFGLERLLKDVAQVYQPTEFVAATPSKNRENELR